MWQILILFYFLFGTAYYLLRRVLAQQVAQHNQLINAIFFVFFLLPAGAILTFLFPHDLHIGVTNIVLLLIGSLIYPISYIVAFKANETVDVGTFTIISNLTPLVTIVIAFSFFHETLTIVQGIGAGLIILSGCIAAWSGFDRKTFFQRSGIMTCLLYVMILGVAIAYEGWMLRRVDFGAYIVYGWGAQILWGVLLAARDIKNLPVLLTKDPQTRRAVLGMGLAGALRSVSFILALKLAGSSSIISSASNFLSVAVILGAYVFLRERNNIMIKSIAVAIGIAGLLLIAK